MEIWMEELGPTSAVELHERLYLPPETPASELAAAKEYMEKAGKTARCRLARGPESLTDGGTETELFASGTAADFGGFALAALAERVPGSGYKLCALLADSGEYGFYKWAQGAPADLDEAMTEAIVDEPGHWETDLLDLSVEADFDACPELAERLHALVAKYLPPEELEFCAENWEPDAPDYDPGFLLNSVAWPAEDLHAVAAFFTELEELLRPLGEEADWSLSGDCWVDMERFGVATVDLSGERVRLIGTLY